MMRQLAEIILVVDDAPAGRNLSNLFQLREGIPCHSIRNPRQGLGYGYYGGLFAGIFRGLQWIHENWAVDFVLKIDTDAIVIGPFSEWLGRTAREAPAAGLIGTVGITCNRDFYSFGSEQHTRSPLVEALHSSNVSQERNALSQIPHPFESEASLREVQRSCFEVCV